MTFVGTITSGLLQFASVVFPREHRSPVAGSSAWSRSHTSAGVPTIGEMLAGRSAGNGLTMRWFADDASLTAAWGGPGSRA